MVELVGGDPVVRLDDGAEQPLVGGVAACEHECGVGAVPACEGRLDLVPNGMIAAQQPRRAAASLSLNGRPRLLAITEIVIRREVDPGRRREPAMSPLRPEQFHLPMPARFEAHSAPGAGRPIARSSSASPSADGLGAVSNLSPKKMEFAPARKQSSCSSR